MRSREPPDGVKHRVIPAELKCMKLRIAAAEIEGV
jgi:hypothetical protein